MSSPKKQRIQDDVPISQSPTPSMEIQPDLPETPPESTHCVDYEKSLLMPTNDLPIDDPDRTAPKHIPALHHPRSIVIVPMEEIEQPDYMGFSILTVICCCSLLGVAAFVFSKLTKKANREGNITAAQRYSRTALVLCFLSLVSCLVLLIFYYIYVRK